jgi:hypothetical protein
MRRACPRLPCSLNGGVPAVAQRTGRGRRTEVRLSPAGGSLRRRLSGSLNNATRRVLSERGRAGGTKPTSRDSRGTRSWAPRSLNTMPVTGHRPPPAAARSRTANAPARNRDTSAR